MFDLFDVTADHDPGGRVKPKWPAGSVVAATFSGPNDCYRTELSEIWDDALPLVGWLMMNPSVAGVRFADPTLSKTSTFSRRWGFGGQIITNVHDYRVTDSKLLAGVAEPVGPDNDEAIMRMAARVRYVVLAYGKPPPNLRPRARAVVAALRNTGVPLKYLRLSGDGTPWHPLYLPGNLEPHDFAADDRPPKETGDAN